MNENLQDRISQGITLMRAERFEAAKKLFEAILEQEPECLDAYFHLGNAYVNLEQYDDAIRSFSAALMLKKDDPELLFSIANVYYLKEDDQNAVKYYLRADQAGYPGPDVWLNLADIFYRAGDSEQALRNINRAVKAVPLRGELWREKILLELELGQADVAMNSLDEFEAILPDALDIHELRTRLLAAQGRYDEAKTHLARALAAFPDDMRLRLLKLQLLDDAGEAEALKQELREIREKGLDKGYRKPIALIESAACVRENDTDGLLKCLDWAMEESPKDPELLFILLNIHIATLNYPAILTVSEVLSACEGVQDSMAASAAFYHAMALRETGKTEQAQTELKKLSRELRSMTIGNPDQTDIYMYRIMTHNALGEYDRAMELADYLAQFAENAADAHAFRSLIYRAMGEDAKADAEMAEAAKLNANYEDGAQ